MFRNIRRSFSKDEVALQETTTRIDPWNENQWERFFEDPMLEEINDPVITPRGRVYDKIAILSYLKNNKFDPENLEETLTIASLRPYPLLTTIKNFTTQNTLALKDSLINSGCFRCPLSGNYFEYPIVDCYGDTYEKSAYDAVPKNEKLPSGKRKPFVDEKTNPTYPARWLVGVMENYCNLTLQKRLESNRKNYIKKLNEYIVERNNHGYYKGPKISWPLQFLARKPNKQSKIKVVNKIIKKLENFLIKPTTRKNNSVFFTSAEKKIIQQGTLCDVGGNALNHLENQSRFKKTN